MRKFTRKEIRQLAEAAQKPVTLDPEFVEITRTLSIPEIVEAVRNMTKKPKRSQGRPAFPDKFAVLDAAALAKVREGKYSHIAPRWNLTTRQLTDLVEHNRPYFASKVKALRKNIAI
jgi:hypothetical protein